MKTSQPPSETAIAMIDSVGKEQDAKATEQFVDFAADNLEQMVDALLEEGVLKEIPVIGSFVKLARAGISFKDALFVQKLVRFLRDIDKIKPHDRIQFWQKLDKEPAFKRKVGEKLLIAIDQMDDFEKAHLLASAFEGYVKGSYDYPIFSSLASAINRLVIAYADDFMQIYWLNNRFVDVFDERCSQLQTCDMLRQHGGTWDPPLGTFRWTRIGKTFFEEVLPRDNESLKCRFLELVGNMPIVRRSLPTTDTDSIQSLLEIRSFLERMDPFLLELNARQISGPGRAWRILRIDEDQFELRHEDKGTIGGSK